MNQKRVFVLVAFLLGLLVLAGCTAAEAPAAPVAVDSDVAPVEDSAVDAPDSPASDGERKILTMWFWGAEPKHQETLRDVLAGGYNASQDEYTLEIEFRNTVDKDVPVALAAGEGPDIVYASGPAFTAPYAEAGRVISLDGYAEQYGWQGRVLPLLYNASTVNDSLYSIPNSISVGGIYYSKAVLDELGFDVPETIPEVEAIMDAAMAAGMYGSVGGNKGWRPVNDNYTANYLNSFADPIDVYNALTGETPWNNPKIKSAVEKSAEWYQKGYMAGDEYMSQNAVDAFQLMADGRAPFFFGPSLLFQFAEAFFTGDKADDLGFAPMPSIDPNQPQPVYSVSTPATFSINAASEYQDAAAEVLDMILTEQFLVDMTERWPGYWGVPLQEVNVNPDDFQGLSRTFLQVVKDASVAINEGQFGFHPTTFFPPATQEKWRDIDSVWLGELTADEMLDAVDAEFAVELEKGLVSPLIKPAVPTE
jgi:raffinose/stachyose/melibiose transport system substrate-binding protein